MLEFGDNYLLRLGSEVCLPQPEQRALLDASLVLRTGEREIHGMLESAVLVSNEDALLLARSFHTVFERLTDAALAAPDMGGTTR